MSFYGMPHRALLRTVLRDALRTSGGAVILLCLLVAAPSSTGSAVAASRAPAVQLPRSELFTFHSDAFVNLHHFLYRWAQAEPGAERPPADPRITVSDHDVERYEAMTGADREEWDRAAAYYRWAVVERDLLFDQEMVALRDCLVMAGNYCDRIAERDLETLDMLNRVMPVYRGVFWSNHDASNRRWIEDVLPRARRFESDIAPRLAAAYTGTWRDGRSRVDVTVYANNVGGYTTADGHITASSVDPGNEGWLGLELLFHEASHGDTLERPLRRLIRSSFDAIEAETPPDLWHMTIFYTAGHITRQVLGESGIDYPQTYAEYAGIYQRREANARAKAALDAAWGAALQAREGFAPAMERVASAWQAQ